MKAPELNPLERRYQGEHPLRTLWYLLEPERGHVARATVWFLIKHSPVWFMPVLTANIIDVVVQHRPIGELWGSALLLAILLLQNVPMHYLCARALSLATRAVETRLRSALCRRLQHLSIGYYARKSTGALQNKVVRDVETTVDMMRQLFIEGMTACTNLAVALTITAIRAPAFVPFFLLTVPASALLIRSVRRPMVARNRQFREELERVTARVSEMTHLIPITRAHGLEQAELSRMDQSLLQLRNVALELDSINAIFGALSWVAYNLFNVACLIIAAWVAYTQLFPITAGDVVMLSSYFGTLTSSVMVLINLAPAIGKGFESIRSIGEVLESPDLEQNAGKAPVESVQGEIRFETVSFQYDQSELPAIHNLSLHVQPGETIALVGPSGAGKSTVLNLVIGFIRPTAGRVLLDGRDMESLDLRLYRRFVSVVPQETILFEGAVRDNVTYGLESIRDETVLAALRQANALEFVERLPKGLDTHIGERGAKLSGGQKQRLAIARALIRNPRVLILDEATSALDTESEALIQEALERLMQGRTTFVVAHRLSTIRYASRILVLDRGQLVESGAHAELLASQGLYARLQAGTAKSPEGERSRSARPADLTA